MKLGIMSDSHDNMPLIAKTVALFNREKVDLVLHAGDFVSPFTNIEFRKLNAKMVAVFGNNDGDKPYLLKRFADIGEIQDDFRELEMDGRKIVLMHQPKFLESLGVASGYDLVVLRPHPQGGHPRRQAAGDQPRRVQRLAVRPVHGRYLGPPNDEARRSCPLILGIS